MARSGVTREQVFEAADALVLEGKSPTVMAVRSKLGGGSPNTITPFLGEWKALQESERAKGLPSIPDSVEALMGQLWGTAWKVAQEQLEGEREALGNARQTLEKERAEMLAEITRLDTELEGARGEVQHKTEALETERHAHEQTKSHAREAASLAQEREKRITALEAELKEEKQARSQAEKDLTELRVEAATLSERAAHVDELRALVKSLREHPGSGEG